MIRNNCSKYAKLVWLIRTIGELHLIEFTKYIKKIVCAVKESRKHAHQLTCTIIFLEWSNFSLLNIWHIVMDIISSH